MATGGAEEIDTLLECDSSDDNETSDDGEQEVQECDLGSEYPEFGDTIEEDSEEEEKENDSDKPKRQVSKMTKDDIVAAAKENIKKLYEESVRPRFSNILTDFVDAEVFFIDGDSLLMELLAESTLDWAHGGQFLHLTFLFERFLQYFTDKDGVFHVIFFQEMETIWSCQPSMLLARQAIISHLQHNTQFTVTTEYQSMWDEGWTAYIKDQSPAFLLLCDAENIPWNVNEKERSTLEFIFHTLLGHSLHLGLNCVFISGIDLTATKLMGFYIESNGSHAFSFKKGKEVNKACWDHCMTEAQSLTDQLITSSGCCTTPQFDGRKLLEILLSNGDSDSSLVECRDIASILACSGVASRHLSRGDTSKATNARMVERIKIFLLHVVLLNHLPLTYRAQQVVEHQPPPALGKTNNSFAEFFRELHTSLYQAMTFVGKVQSGSFGFKTASDVMDGRLFYWLFAQYLEMHSREVQGLILPEGIAAEVNQIWGHVARIVNNGRGCTPLEPSLLPLFANDAPRLSVAIGPVIRASGTSVVMGLLPIDNALVNGYVKDIRTKSSVPETDDETNGGVVVKGREFREVYHWHSLKLLTDDYERTKHDDNKMPEDRKERKKFLINKQKFSRYMEFYGKSLEKDIGAAEVITVSDQKKTKSKKDKKASKVSEGAQKIINENKERKEDKEHDKTKENWENTKRAFDKDMHNKKFKRALDCIDEFLGGCKVPSFVVQASMSKAKCCFEAWRDERLQNSDYENPKLPASLFQVVQEVIDRGDLASEKQKKKLADYFKRMGFGDIAGLLHPPVEDKNSSKKDKEVLSVGMSSARFQMEHMGHLLKRDVRKDADPRVKHFIPDTWQRELLDAVDKRESAVIVAPTSSGKTFCSYYCMEKVLRESNEGVVVYVSPTKALVNQVAATVYARFRRKQLPEGKSVCGVFTRDLRKNTLNSQILVTVPQCLEILLLSPKRQRWTKNIKYVIFDEVHCLGQEIGAEVWEHLLLLIRCPFLALSATIGNPEDLRSWLQKAQNFRREQDIQDGAEQESSYNVRLVVYSERYSDLEKSIYLPHPPEAKATSLQRTEDFVSLHPCGQLNTKQLLNNGFPKDMALTPKEALQLFDVMKTTWPDRESLEHLDPDFFFMKEKIMKKADARRYETALKHELKTWADEQHLDEVETVLSGLRKAVESKLEETTGEWLQKRIDPTSSEFIFLNFMELLEKLEAQGKLPALVFSFDRRFCEDLTREIIYTLGRRRREIINENQQTIKDLEKEERRLRKDEKRLRDKKDDYEISDFKNIDVSDIRKQLSVCTFADTHAIKTEDMKAVLRQIRFVPGNELFKRELRAGIGYHHAGVHKKMRDSVEILFRQQFLKVVVATGTLALGIHMPCKTVVFAGDSLYLNSVQYRQMAGRSGRRGYDPVGNVIFFGVPYRKVRRLITANIPHLEGNFPITISLVLRLLLLTAEGKEDKAPLRKAQSLLEHPFICQGLPDKKDQIKHHFLFSVEFLARQEFIDLQGIPQDFAGLATHLHYHEPANFVLISFLQQGLFHELCKPNDVGEFSEDVMRELVLVLSHLFGRTYLHANFRRTLDMCPSSKVILEDLPQDFADALQKYNERVNEIFDQYLTTVAIHVTQQKGEERKLPISGIDFPSCTDGSLERHGIIEQLSESATEYYACSAFAALSGNSDQHLHSTNSFSAQSAEQAEESEQSGHLLEIVRQDVYTDMNAIPVLPLKKFNRAGQRIHLNAYALDFFKHGSVKSITQENRIRGGQVYQLLKDFYLVIASISTSLKEMGPEEDNVVLAFNQLNKEYNEQLYTNF